MGKCCCPQTFVRSQSRFSVSAQDQTNYLVRAIADQQIHFVTVFAGKVDAARLERAVYLALEAESVLRCQFVPHSRRPYWQARRDLGNAAYFDTVDTCDQASLWRFITSPTDPCEDAVLQVRLFRSDVDSVCVKLNHVAADAAGCKQYAYLLARIYRTLGSDPSYHPEPPARMERGQGQLFRHFGFRQLLRAYQRRLSPTPAWGFPARPEGCSARFFEVRRFAPARFQAIRDYGHERHSTVNDILLAAFFRALFAVADPPAGRALPVGVTVDLRRHLPRAHRLPICSFSGSVFPAISRVPGECFDETVARTTCVMNELKAESPGLSTAVFQELDLARGFARAQQGMQFMVGMAAKYGTFYPMLTNFGVIDERLLDFGNPQVADAFMTSPIFFPPGLMVGVNTYRETMTLTTGGCDRPDDRQKIRFLMNQFDSELPGEQVAGHS